MPDIRKLPLPSLPVPSWGAIRQGALLASARVSGIAAQMGVQVAVGALAGAAGIGTLQLHMAWSAVIGEILGAGEATRAMRDTAVASPAQVQHTVPRNLRRAAIHILAWSTALLALLLAVNASGVGAALSVSQQALILSIATAAPLFALTRLLAETLKALGKPLLAVTVENTAIPVAILTACAVLWLGPVPGVSASPLLLAAVIGGAAAPLILFEVLRRFLRTTKNNQESTGEAPRALQPREQLHFWLTGLLNIAFLQLPFLIMPWVVNAEDIGRFAVAHKLVNVITTLLILLAAVYGPRFARAVNRGNIDEARGLLRETQYLSLAVFVPIWLGLLLLADPLAELFNVGPGTLALLLLILGSGQFINAAAGLSGVLLNMSGAPHLETLLLTIAVAMTTVFALIFGSLWGAAGIAGACATGIAARNLASFTLARLHLGKLEQQAL